MAENMERLLGRLLESAQRNTTSLDNIQSQLADIAPITALFAAHERQDTQRHDDNIGEFGKINNRLDKVDNRLASLENINAGEAGTRRGIGLVIATVAGLGGGGAVAGALAFLRKIGLL